MLSHRTLTVVHVRDAEQFTSLSDLISHRFSELLKLADMKFKSDVDCLRKVIEMVGIVCSVTPVAWLVNGMLFTNIVYEANCILVLKFHCSAHN